MSRLPHRWRTQQNAIRNANCRTRESSNLWTQVALAGNPASMSVWVSVKKDTIFFFSLFSKLKKNTCVRIYAPLFLLFFSLLDMRRLGVRMKFAGKKKTFLFLFLLSVSCWKPVFFCGLLFVFLQKKRNKRKKEGDHLKYRVEWQERIKYWLVSSILLNLCGLCLLRILCEVIELCFFVSSARYVQNELCSFWGARTVRVWQHARI